MTSSRRTCLTIEAQVLLLRIGDTTILGKDDRIGVFLPIRIGVLRIDQHTITLRSELFAKFARKFFHAMQYRLFSQYISIYFAKALHYVECFHELPRASLSQARRMRVPKFTFCDEAVKGGWKRSARELCGSYLTISPGPTSVRQALRAIHQLELQRTFRDQHVTPDCAVTKDEGLLTVPLQSLKVKFMKTRYSHRKWLLTAVLAVTSVTATSAIAAEQAVHIRGTITGVTATGFTVQTDAGSRTVVIASDTRITGVVPSSLEQIQTGSFIGSANVPDGTTSRALEVVVFPPAMKGSGLGDYAWDPPASGNGSAMASSDVMPSAMTNGTVKMMKPGESMPSAMTNGTVKSATNGGDRALVVDYGKGEKTIVVPADASVVTFQPATKADIIKGAHVFVAANPGNPVIAKVVGVGIKGTVPPM